MVSKQQLQATVYTLILLLVTGMPLVPAQPLQLVYIDRPGDNRILLECRQTVTSVAVTSPQIWVERFDLPDSLSQLWAIKVGGWQLK